VEVAVAVGVAEGVNVGVAVAVGVAVGVPVGVRVAVCVADGVALDGTAVNLGRDLEAAAPAMPETRGAVREGCAQEEAQAASTSTTAIPRRIPLFECTESLFHAALTGCEAAQRVV
jgi:hypothetical protein